MGWIFVDLHNVSIFIFTDDGCICVFPEELLLTQEVAFLGLKESRTVDLGMYVGRLRAEVKVSLAF